MANAGGFLKESNWRDRDWRALSRTAQATYAQLTSQKELDRAGILPLQPTKWVKGCDAMTADDLDTDLKELIAARFVFIDEDTDELLIRSYIRHSGAVKQPNVFKSALRSAAMVASEHLRHELAKELRSLRRADATTVANEIDPGAPVDTYDDPSRTVAEPIANPSTTPNPSGTLPEPSGTGLGMGAGVTSVGGWVGRSREADADSGTTETTSDRDAPTTPTPPTEQPAPPPRCARHLDAPTDRPCRACGEARVAREAWDVEQAERRRQAAADERHAAAVATRAAIDACELCDDDGYRGTRVCAHDPDQDDRVRRGLEKARAALAGEVVEG